MVLEMPFTWESKWIKDLIHQSLQEDDVRHDITTCSFVPASLRIEALIVSKQAGVVCGLPFAQAVYNTLSPHFHFRSLVKEGQWVPSGARLSLLRGNARSILSGERTALNAIQHLSGIATFTRQQIQRLGRSSVKLLDTRKTLPGWRGLQKYAVKCGGGSNHRSTLAEAILIKDNHLKVLRLAGVPWTQQAMQLKVCGKSLEIEVQDDQDLRDVFMVKPNRVLLDNLPPKRLKKWIDLLRERIPGVQIEISGGVKPADLPRLRHAGADWISMGRLTHSTPAFDCSLDIVRVLS